MNHHLLDPRLQMIAELVVPGSIIADIGTDHAYLPIELIQTNRCPFAIASDIREGPLDNARKNIQKSGLTDKIDIVLCNGLDAIGDYHPDGIVIAGMGGELIASILNKAPFLQIDRPRLILQPMTMQHELRRYLWNNGFSIQEERLCDFKGHLYSIICSVYDGQIRTPTDLECLIGEPKKIECSPLYPQLLLSHINRLKKRAGGLISAGHDASYEYFLLEELQKLLKTERKEQAL